METHEIESRPIPPEDQLEILRNTVAIWRRSYYAKADELAQASKLRAVHPPEWTSEIPVFRRSERWYAAVMLSVRLRRVYTYTHEVQLEPPARSPVQRYLFGLPLEKADPAAVIALSHVGPHIGFYGACWELPNWRPIRSAADLRRMEEVVTDALSEANLESLLLEPREWLPHYSLGAKLPADVRRWICRKGHGNLPETATGIQTTAIFS